MGTADALFSLPPGSAWAVAVSGGADSVELLLRLHERGDLSLRVFHFNHQTRGAENDADAAFVAALAARLGLPCTVGHLSQIEATFSSVSPNPSARYRDARYAFFRQQIDAHGLNGVALGHHADDQAETILHGLLRGAGPLGLGAMTPARADARGRWIVRPLLHERRATLRAALVARGESWREDPSNASDAYARNRHRKFLDAHPELTEPLLQLGRASEGLRAWVRRTAAALPPRFETTALAAQRSTWLARESARQWFLRAGATQAARDGRALARLVEMAADAATPHAQDFPGRFRVFRRGGFMWGHCIDIAIAATRADPLTFPDQAAQTPAASGVRV